MSWTRAAVILSAGYLAMSAALYPVALHPARLAVFQVAVLTVIWLAVLARTLVLRWRAGHEPPDLSR